MNISLRAKKSIREEYKLQGCYEKGIPFLEWWHTCISHHRHQPLAPMGFWCLEKEYEQLEMVTPQTPSCGFGRPNLVGLGTCTIGLEEPDRENKNMEVVQIFEPKKNKEPRKPDFSSRDGIHIWKNCDKNGKEYLSVRIPLLNLSANCFQPLVEEEQVAVTEEKIEG